MDLKDRSHQEVKIVQKLRASRLSYFIRSYGFVAFLQRSLSTLLRMTCGWCLHNQNRPTLGELNSSAELCCTDSRLALTSLVGADVLAGLASYESEYAEVCQAISERYRVTGLTHPGEYGIGDSSNFLLWALVRHLRPCVVVETGIANGHSSFFILNALTLNQQGTLHSFDISLDSGRLVPERLQQNWVKHLVQSTQDFCESLEQIGPVCMFIHDSDHDYFHQQLEYSVAFRNLKCGGILASDDVDWNYAFLDFCKQSRLRPTLLIQPAKAFGVIRASDAHRIIRSGA